MSKFMAIHTLKAPTTTEAIIPIARSAKAHLSPDAYWVSSWLQMNDEGKVTRIICEWDAKNAESVTEILKAHVPDLPVDGLYPMAEIQSESYR